MWIRKAASFTATLINKASRGLAVLAIICMLAMLVLTVGDVFLRYFFNSPISDSVQLTEYFMVVTGFLGLAWCAVKGGHLKVDMIISHLPPRFQAITNSITIILALTVVPLVAWQGFARARYSQIEKLASDVLEIPSYPFYIVVGFGCSFLFLVLVIRLAELIAKATKR